MDIARFRRALTAHEGLRLKPYRCTAGKLTIGIGRNLEDVGISNEEANFLLDADIGRVVFECKKHFPWFDGLDDVRQEVVANMVFNLGISRFREFKRMIAAIETGDYATAALEMRSSKWAAQVGERAEDLSAMMATGSEKLV